MSWRLVEALELQGVKYSWYFDGTYANQIIEDINNGSYNGTTLGAVIPPRAPSEFSRSSGNYTGGQGNYEESITHTANAVEPYRVKRGIQSDGWIVRFPDFGGSEIGFGYYPSTYPQYSENYYDKYQRYSYANPEQPTAIGDECVVPHADQALRDTNGSAWSYGTMIGFSMPSDECFFYLDGENGYKSRNGFFGLFFIADDENHYMQAVHYKSSPSYSGGEFTNCLTWEGWAPSPGSVNAGLTAIYDWLIGTETDPDPEPGPGPGPGPDPFDPGDSSDGSYDNSVPDGGQIGGDTYHPQPTDQITSIGISPPIADLKTSFYNVFLVPDIPVAGSQSEIEKLADELWSDDFWDEIEKYYNSPTDMIIGMYMLPFVPHTGEYDPNYTPIYGGRQTFTAVGKLMTKRYGTFNLGECNIEPKYNSYFDYYTKIKLYLPFIGEFELSAQDVMHSVENVGSGDDKEAKIVRSGALINLKYEVDYYTGVIVCGVYINGDLHYMFTSNAKVDMPFTFGVNAAAIQETSNFFVTAGAAALAIGALIASGGTAAPAVAAAVGGAGLTAYQGVKAIAANEMGNTTHINGQIGELNGVRTCPYPYIEIEWPVVDYIENLSDYAGQATYKSSKLGVVDSNTSAGGFLVAESVQLTGKCGTDEERDEILKLLKEGVILGTASEGGEGE